RAWASPPGAAGPGPRHAEGTFFAVLMSVCNLGTQGSQVTGGYLYDWIGYTPLVLISAVMTGAAYFLLPLVNIPEIERRARLAGPPPQGVEVPAGKAQIWKPLRQTQPGLATPPAWPAPPR